MRVLRPTNEAEMIVEFLRQELASTERYGAEIMALPCAGGVEPELIRSADMRGDTQNAIRRRVLGRYRGYSTGRSSYFTDFPDQGVAWCWVTLSARELLDCRYIRYSYWNDLSLDTRSPRVAATRLLAEDKPYIAGDPDYVTVFTDLANQLRAGCRVPPLILVSADGGMTRTVLEGHTRLTAYALAPDTIPEPIEALLGWSPAIANWDMY